MELINQKMHSLMSDEAKFNVLWAFELYQSFHAQYPELSDREVYGKMLDQRVKFPGGDKDREIVLDRYGSSLNGLCYYLGLNSILMKDTMIFRCIQFTEYIDIELEKLGIKKPPDEIKRKYFKTLDLPEDAVNKRHL